jgi:uncharacterized protein (TIGR00730 family)
VATRRGRRSTGDERTDRLIEDLLDEIGPTADRDVLTELLVSAARMAADDADRLDLKIAAAALAEMRQAFAAFVPYRDVPKVTIFGSARTEREDPLYHQARRLAEELATRGWMVVTGAGPGIMAAGSEGAGKDKSLGVNIRLPFEQEPNEFIDQRRLVNMKYFFTRKLALVKESQGFVSLPGGFGTLDETFELLTLQQTGKSQPTPIVFLDVPDGTYWEGWRRFVMDEVAARGLISPTDDELFLISDDVAVACEFVTGFYRNYHSIRWVGDQLVVRLRADPSDAEVAELRDEFGMLCRAGAIERSAPLPAEVDDDDALDLSRLVLTFDIRHFSRLHAFIHRVNNLDSAPAAPGPPPLN